MNRIIIRADDLGYSEGINLGITKSVSEGIVTSVGLMTNMPHAQQGVDMMKDLSVCLGLHCNISAGKPLSKIEEIPSLVDENGNFKSSKLFRTTTSDFTNYDEAYKEISAQYDRFVELTGHKPCYIDVHAVYSKNFYRAIQEVAQLHGVDYDLFSRPQPKRFRHTDIYVSSEYNQPDYQPMEAFKRITLQEIPENSVKMFIVHPGYLDAYIVRQSTLLYPRLYDLEMLVSPEVKQWIDLHKVQLISYNDLD